MWLEMSEDRAGVILEFVFVLYCLEFLHCLDVWIILLKCLSIGRRNFRFDQYKSIWIGDAIRIVVMISFLVTPRAFRPWRVGRLVTEPSGYRGNSLIPLSRGSFDVLVGMDRLSKRKFGIVCYEKVVRIPLEGDEILRVHGELEFRVDLVPGATPVVKSPYRLAPLEMQELSEQLRELQDNEEEHGVHLKLELELLRKEKLYAKKGRVKLRWVRAISMTIQSSVKDKILATSSEMSKVENAPAEMLHDLDQQMEKRADDGKANVVTDALSRKEQVKPRLVRAMAMTIQYGVRGKILAAQSEAFNYHLSIRCAPFEALYGRKCRSLVLWADIGESSLTGRELVQETTDKVMLVKEKS
ncbi:hypothetical protein Tco_0943478 [Tanacetum coccineum]